MGPVVHSQEWQIHDMVIYRQIKEKGHLLNLVWIGPVRIVNKASHMVYHLDIRQGKRKVSKWFHSSQLKRWKGESKQ